MSAQADSLQKIMSFFNVAGNDPKTPAGRPASKTAVAHAAVLTAANSAKHKSAQIDESSFTRF